MLTNFFEPDECWKVVTMWKTRIKFDRKETDFSNNPGGLKVKPKCFKLVLQGSIPAGANDLFWAWWGLKVNYNVESEE